MVLGMCSGSQVSSTKTFVPCLLSSMVAGSGLGLHEWHQHWEAAFQHVLTAEAVHDSPYGILTWGVLTFVDTLMAVF